MRGHGIRRGEEKYMADFGGKYEGKVQWKS
jgi:hypothetical protein